jgi:hypothetical protein
LRAVAAVVGIAVGLGACAGSGGAERLSKQEFITEADSICAAANRRIAEIPVPDLANPETAPRAIRRIVAIQRRAVGRLRDLRPPESDEPAIRQWLRAVSAALDQTEAVAVALEQGDPLALVQASQRGTDRADEADRLAGAYGVRRCGTPESAPGTTTTVP